MLAACGGQQNILEGEVSAGKLHQHDVSAGMIDDAIGDLAENVAGSRRIALPAQHDEIAIPFSRGLEDGFRGIVSNADGDLRNAIMGLQFACIGKETTFG